MYNKHVDLLEECEEILINLYKNNKYEQAKQIAKEVKKINDMRFGHQIKIEEDNKMEKEKDPSLELEIFYDDYFFDPEKPKPKKLEKCHTVDLTTGTFKNYAYKYLQEKSELLPIITIDNNPYLDKLRTLKEQLQDLTKNDTEVRRETLSDDEVIQALDNSISKFKELHHQQPKELKHILIDYKETPLKDYITVTQVAISNSDDIKLLDKIFQTYKQDEQHRIYNYDLFAFLYYAYSLKISFEHLYNSRLLKSLGVYTFKADRDKPVLKKNKVSLLQDHKINVELSQYKENIYLHNLIEFIQAVNTKHQNKYLLSYLVDSSHNLKASKEFIESLTCKKSFKNVTYENLPQPINTLLLTPSQIAN